MSRHPELTALVRRLREEHPRPSLRWSELVGQIRAARQPVSASARGLEPGSPGHDTPR